MQQRITVDAIRALDRRAQDWVASYFDFRAARSLFAWLAIPAMVFFIVHDGWTGSSVWEWPLAAVAFVAAGSHWGRRAWYFLRLGRDLRRAARASGDGRDAA